MINPDNLVTRLNSAMVDVARKNICHDSLEQMLAEACDMIVTLKRERDEADLACHTLGYN